MKTIITKSELIDILVTEFDSDTSIMLKKHYLKTDELQFIQACNNINIKIRSIRKNTYII